MMIKNLRAIMGIAESDLKQQFKSGTFVSNIILSVLFTLLLGSALGISSTLRDLPVNIYDPAHRIQFKSTNLVSLHYLTSEELSIQQVKGGQAVAAVIVTDNSVRLILDDTNGPDINGDVSKEMTDQITASLTPAQATILSQVKTESTFGLDTHSQWYSLRLVASQLMPVAVFLFSLVLMGEGLIAEKQSRTLFELAMAPVRSIWIVLGKLLGGAATLVTVLIAVFLVTRYIFGVEANGNLFVAFLACFIMGLGFLGLSYILGAVFPSVEIYRGVVSLVMVMPALFISGIFTPVRSLPGFLQTIANFLPLSWCVDIMRNVTFKHGDFTESSQSLLLLSAFLVVTLVAGPLAVRRLLAASQR